MTRICAARSLAEAIALIESEPSGRLMAGGTDLLVKLRGAPPDESPMLICLDGVPELKGVSEEDGWLAIGAATSFAVIAASPLVAARAPLLQAAAREVGAPAIRNMATLGGNLCTASPAGDSLPPLYALNARVELASNAGCRRMPLSDFITGPGKTRLARGEILRRVLLPLSQRADFCEFQKVGRRRSLAIAVVSFAGLLRLDEGRRIAEARFAFGSVGPTVVTVPEAEAMLRGQAAARLDSAVVDRAVSCVCDFVRPIDDLRASADYRRALAGNLLRRFLASPLRRQGLVANA
jgi:CO/xanthine dehydrogenase FAD-binding subunit